MTNTELAKALRDWRARQRSTQEQAARAFGVCLRTYIRWEAGKARPGASKAAGVATALNLDPFVVMVRPEPLIRADDIERALISHGILNSDGKIPGSAK